MSSENRSRQEPLQSGVLEREVTALELFFDLVFVLAVGQLTHHLVGHPGWRGGAETLVLLVAVLGVWAFTSFEVTLLDVERPAIRALIVGVMGVGLFMNAGISAAFGDGPWLFVGPMLAALVVPGIWAAVAAPRPELRGHFRRVLGWIALSAPLWVVGALAEPGIRLWWWASAALLDLLGTWLAHPVPRRKTRTENLPFDAIHMIERMRLFLIILLGESLLSIGRVLSESPNHRLTQALSLGAFLAVVALWVLYFGRGEAAVLQNVSRTQDPIHAVHLGINVLYGVMFGLILFAAGAELVIGHSAGKSAGVGGVLTLVGPALYLLSQAVYFRATSGVAWVPRVVGVGGLVGLAIPAYSQPAPFSVGALVVVLVVLAAHQSRRGAHAGP
ncbi:MAG: low temperature requirement protein A [Acidobacteria bacterium]|nr:low temperature requirement protein A [Acidobacteriota bacterium]